MREQGHAASLHRFRQGGTSDGREDHLRAPQLRPFPIDECERRRRSNVHQGYPQCVFHVSRCPGRQRGSGRSRHRHQAIGGKAAVGTVYPRGKRLWIGVVDPKSGKQHCVSSGLVVCQERLARDLLAQVEDLMGTSSPRIPHRSPRVSVRAYAQTYKRGSASAGPGQSPTRAMRRRG